MGTVRTITATTFPRQGQHLGRRCQVCFHYDTAHLVPGVIVRDDAEHPWTLIIHLDDGRYVLSEECQYTFDRKERDA